MSSIKTNLKQLGVTLPAAPVPLGNFAPFIIDQNMLMISGQISVDGNAGIIRGKLGDDLNLEMGYQAARLCAIGLLARANAALDGELDRIERLLKLGAFVNATPDFGDHPKVVNGASDFMVEALGPQRGEHVRFAVGSSSLPSNAAVEVEAIFRIRLA